MENQREKTIKILHEAFNLPINAKPSIELLKLRKTLINEEAREVSEEIDKVITKLEAQEEIPQELWADFLKELADLQVVLSGTIISFEKFNKFDEAFERVQESNMSKLGEDGKPIYREDGKFLKGPNYFKPDLSDLV